MIIAKADKTQIENVVDNIEKALRKSRELEKGKEDFYVASFQELLNSYMSALNIIIGFVILIALISVLVSAINTANTMITSVLERVKEVGTMKAIGAKNSEIFAIFLFESSILGFVAGLIGIFFGFIITFVAKQILSNLGWSFLSPHYSPSLFIGCILFAVVTGAISGVAPAVNASRTNVVDALRYE
jgi:putative ABC transport system permease protein